MSNDATTDVLRASDGASIAWRARWGRAGAPVLVLVHSLGMDQSFWDPVAGCLAGHATVLTLDARGHGRSGGTAIDAGRMALDLRELGDSLGLAQLVVGGCSMGGCVALQFAIDHPARCAALALVDTTAWYGPTAPSDWEERARKARAEGLASLVGFQQSRWFSDAFRAREPQVVQGCVETFLRNDLDSYAASCRMLGRFDARAQLGALRMPTAVVVGEEDYAAPVAMSRALHEGIAGSTLEVIPGARHLTPLEVPERIAAVLLALCDRAPAKEPA